MFVNAQDYNLTDKIYRVTTFENFLDILINQRMTFVKPSLWDDPLENMLWKQKYISLSGKSIEFKSLREGVFGQCWTFNNEKDYSWKVYAPNKNGIKIQSTIKTFHDAINRNIKQGDEFLVKRVNYIDLRGAINEWNEKGFNKEGFFLFSRDMLFYKDLPFDHEEEFRAIYISKSPEDQKNDVIYFSLDPNTVIESITVDSRLDNDRFKEIKNTIRKLGYNGLINHSNLYKIPKINFRINV